MIKLSILIPTYNRCKRLKNSLTSYTQEKTNCVEFIVVDNFSDDNTEGLIRSFMVTDSRIKYFKNPQNLGYNRNLFRGYLEASSNWICILPDDDKIETGFITELIEIIEKNENCSLIIPTQKDQNNNIKNLAFNKTVRLNGKDSVKTAFKTSGAVTGFTFNTKFLNQKDWFLDNSIYPQIRIALNLSLNKDIIFFRPNKCPTVCDNDEIIDMVNDAMGRPLDYGVFERIEILHDISKNPSFPSKNVVYELEAGLFIWTVNIIRLLNEKDQNYSRKYLKNLRTKKEIRTSSIFMAILLKDIVLKKEAGLWLKIASLQFILISALSSLLSFNLYGSFWFILKNFKSNLKAVQPLSK